jgi:hypothetical protein
MGVEAIRPRAELRCPLCGGPNGCGPAAGGSFDGPPCWCREVVFSAELLARVPAGQRGQACICRACATAAKAATAATAAAAGSAGEGASAGLTRGIPPPADG